MVQKINPHPALGCNRSPPIMYFQKMQFLGVFRPFLQRSLNKYTLSAKDFYMSYSPHAFTKNEFRSLTNLYLQTDCFDEKTKADT